jgi:hypothetical protein
MRRILIRCGISICCAICLLGCMQDPRATYLYCHGDSSKVLTIFHPGSTFGRSALVYIIPGRYSGTDTPTYNYVKIRPQFDQSLDLNWQPRDGHIMYIRLALCEQAFEDHLDTAKYRFFKNCGQHEYYMDENDSFYSPKYSSFGWNEWEK